MVAKKTRNRETDIVRRILKNDILNLITFFEIYRIDRRNMASVRKFFINAIIPYRNKWVCKPSRVAFLVGWCKQCLACKVCLTLFEFVFVSMFLLRWYQIIVLLRKRVKLLFDAYGVTHCYVLSNFSSFGNCLRTNRKPAFDALFRSARIRENYEVIECTHIKFSFRIRIRFGLFIKPIQHTV